MSVLHGSGAMGVLMTAALALVASIGCDGGTAFRPPADTSGGRVVPGAEGAPTITMITPTTDRFVFQGDTIQISWVDTDPDDNAEVTVFAFLDGDRNQVPDTGAVTLVLEIVSEDPDGASDMYTWLTAGFPEGTYAVGATIDDFENPPATDFALGHVIISVQRSLNLDLGDAGARFAATRWHGWNAGDWAGWDMDGGMDVNGDGIDDMVIAARYGNPFLLSNGFYGEGYLIFGRPIRFRAEEQLNSVAVVGADGIAGTVFAGPWPDMGSIYDPDSTATVITSDTNYRGTLGMNTVALIPNLETAAEDAIGGAEIAFGFEFVDGLRDEVDYDPADNDEIHSSDDIELPIGFQHERRVSNLGIVTTTIVNVTAPLPVEGLEGWYLDFDPIWTYEHEYIYTDAWEDTVGDPNDPNGGSTIQEPRTKTYNIIVRIDLPFIITEPGNPFVQLELQADPPSPALDDPVPAQAYPLCLSPNAESNGDDLAGDRAPHTGAVILVSSRGNGSETAPNLDRQVVILQEVGQEGALPFAGLAIPSYGVRFRPPYTYTYQDEVDNWYGWQDPRGFNAISTGSWPQYVELVDPNTGELSSENHLIPSRWGESISYADMNGDGFPELLIGAPLAPSSSNYLSNGDTVNLPGAGWRGWPPSAVISGPHDAGDIPTANQFFRSNNAETGMIAVIWNRNIEPSMPEYPGIWYDQFTRDEDREPYPSWPVCVGDNEYGFPDRQIDFEPDYITARQSDVVVDDPPGSIDYESRFWLYPGHTWVQADLRKAGPRGVHVRPQETSPLGARFVEGGELGGVVGLGALDVTTPGVQHLVQSDFNDDGIDDLACGAPKASLVSGGTVNAGIAYVVSPRRAQGFFNLDRIEENDPTEALVGLEILGTQGQVRDGQGNVTDEGDLAGFAQAGTTYYKVDPVDPLNARVIDFNGDGIADWLFGVPGRNPKSRTDAGMAVLVFGHTIDRAISGSFTLDQLNTDTNGPLGIPDGVLDEWDLLGVRFIGEQPGDEAGYWVAGAGDNDADGYSDILIAAPGYDYDEDGDGTADRTECGKVYLIYGSPWFSDLSNPTWSNANKFDRSTYDLRTLGGGDFADALPGKAYIGAEESDPTVKLRIGPVAWAGDVDTDGFDDFLIGSPYATQRPGKIEAGECFLIYGTLRNQP